MFSSPAAPEGRTRWSYTVIRWPSAGDGVRGIRGGYGPLLKAFAAIDLEARKALEADLYALLDEFNVAEDGTLIVPSEYLEVVIVKNRLH